MAIALMRITLLIGVAIVAGGCGSKMLTAKVLNNTAADALEEATKLRRENVVSDEQFRVVVRVAEAAEPVLDELTRAAIANDGFKFALVLPRVYAAVDAVLREVALLRKPKEVSYDPRRNRGSPQAHRIHRDVERALDRSRPRVSLWLPRFA